MNRGILVGLIFLYLVLIAYMGTVMDISVTETIAGDPNLGTIDASVNIWDMLGTFFNMLSFQVNIPAVINLFLVYPPIIVLIWQVVEILKDLVPLT